MLGPIALVGFVAFPLVFSLPEPPNAVSRRPLEPFSVDDGVNMKWSGPIFPGEEPTVLYGTAQDIYEAIIVVNPNYAPNDSAKARGTFLGHNGTEAKLARRDYYNCGVMATGSRANLYSAAEFLQSLGGTCGAPARDCRRMTCENTTGSYICSEKDSEAQDSCSDVSNYIVEYIWYWCCPLNGGVSGSVYLTDTLGLSIWGGYANCGDSSSSRPTNYPYPGGSPNGLCDPSG